LDELNALDLLSPPCGNGLTLLDKVLATCSINESSSNAHALFVASRTFNEPDPAGFSMIRKWWFFFVAKASVYSEKNIGSYELSEGIDEQLRMYISLTGS
jgi:hypothetical protein